MENTSNMTVPPPDQQIITLASPDGPVQFTLLHLDYYVSYGISNSINLGTQIGASFSLLCVLLLLTDTSKRRSLIYILNVFSLVCNLVRTICSVMFYAGGFYSPYAYFTFDYTDVPRSSYAASIMANVFTLLVLVCIESSLVFQVRISCSTTRERERLWITMFVVLVALVAIGFRFAVMVKSNMATLSLQPMADMTWLTSATNITTSVSIAVFCAIFLWRLGVAIKRQRSLGIKKFGPMQALFIMGCQTMFVPTLFAVFQYVGDAVQLTSQVLTVTVLFLPLSAMWASSIAAQEMAAKQTEVGPANNVKFRGSPGSEAYASRKGFVAKGRASASGATARTDSTDTGMTSDGSTKGSALSDDGILVHEKD